MMTSSFVSGTETLLSLYATSALGSILSEAGAAENNASQTFATMGAFRIDVRNTTVTVLALNTNVKRKMEYNRQERKEREKNRGKKNFFGVFFESLSSLVKLSFLIWCFCSLGVAEIPIQTVLNPIQMVIYFFFRKKILRILKIAFVLSNFLSGSFV